MPKPSKAKSISDKFILKAIKRLDASERDYSRWIFCGTISIYKATPSWDGKNYAELKPHSWYTAKVTNDYGQNYFESIEEYGKKVAELLTEQAKKVIKK